jgi:hypothetical protein
MEYLEKVRSQFLSLRHPNGFLCLSLDRLAETAQQRGLSRDAIVPEIARLRHFLLGDVISLQSFVLRDFSMVQEGQLPEPQLAVRLLLVSNPSRASAMTLEPG